MFDFHWYTADNDLVRLYNKGRYVDSFLDEQEVREYIREVKAAAA